MRINIVDGPHLFAALESPTDYPFVQVNLLSQVPDLLSNLCNGESYELLDEIFDGFWSWHLYWPSSLVMMLLNIFSFWRPHPVLDKILLPEAAVFPFWYKLRKFQLFTLL
jgi:hypothetical protein